MPRFEWDEAKAAGNHTLHGVGFADAATACGDPFCVEWLDERFTYGEERWALLGCAGPVVLYVVYTERADALRIVSARRATRHEQDEYFRQNSR